jgi:hypothetical protein
MATFIAGFIIGGYTGALLREEYTIPTSEKISQAFEVFKSNEKIIHRTTDPKKPESSPNT